MLQLEQLRNSYKHLYHASICIEERIYIDPFNLDIENHSAQYIFITHPHFDHLSLNDIEKIVNDETIFVATLDSIEILKKAGYKNKMIEAKIGMEYELKDFKFKVIRAYNLNKQFHPYSNNWVGYLFNIKGNSYYVMGDSDYTSEASEVKCDVLFVPIGGTYTLDYLEASKLVNKIHPLIAVATHYNTLDNLRVNKEDFVKLIDKDIIVD